ncbi:MAG: hypothetical protein ACI8QC_004103 [Planctomycetota bacterium]|jgi:hypothetical protein
MTKNESNQRSNFLRYILIGGIAAISLLGVTLATQHTGQSAIDDDGSCLIALVHGHMGWEASCPYHGE